MGEIIIYFLVGGREEIAGNWGMEILGLSAPRRHEEEAIEEEEEGIFTLRIDLRFYFRSKNSRDPANDPTEHWTGRETRLSPSPSVVIRGIIAGLWSVVCQSQFRAVFQLPADR